MALAAWLALCALASTAGAVGADEIAANALSPTAGISDALRREVAAVDPLTVTPEMATFVRERVGRKQTRQARLRKLHDSIFDPKGLGVTYGSTATHTAEETFRGGAGNCLSFTLLFVALARELDLDAYFVEVDEVTGWSQRGGVGFSHWHMFVEVELDNGVERIDFLPWLERRYHSTRRIDETRARAHFHSNLGAEQLTAGKEKAAIAHFERALELDPTFHPARVNLAVAYRRTKQNERAIEALVHVLELEPSNAVAAANLASIYVALGRRAEAKEWLARREDFLRQNPFHHFRLGLQALDDDDPEAARDHFRRAIARQTDESVFYEMLASAQQRLGEVRKARGSLRQALRWNDDPDRAERLEALLRERMGGLSRTP